MSEERAIELEARMAWYERQHAELDQVVRELVDEVMRLKRELAALTEQVSPGIGGGEEAPPHY